MNLSKTNCGKETTHNHSATLIRLNRAKRFFNRSGVSHTLKARNEDTDLAMNNLEASVEIQKLIDQAQYRDVSHRVNLSRVVALENKDHTIFNTTCEIVNNDTNAAYQSQHSHNTRRE